MNTSFQDLSHGILYFNIVRIFKTSFGEERFHFIWFEVDLFKKCLFELEGLPEHFLGELLGGGVGRAMK